MTRPIRRHPALVSFSREHHFGLLLVWKMRQGINKDVAPECIAKYCQAFFESELVPHFKQEEEKLFSLLYHDDPLRIRAQEEHQLIREQIKQITSQTAKEKLSIIADTLEKHIRFEERELFPYIEKTANFEKFVDAMDLHAAQTECLIDNSWPDQFWLKDAR